MHASIPCQRDVRRYKRMARMYVLQFVFAKCRLSAGEAYPEDSRLNKTIGDPRAAL